MDLTYAKAFDKTNVKLSWYDRSGELHTEDVYVMEVGFVPMYGQCMVTSVGEIRLDRIHTCERLDAAA